VVVRSPDGREVHLPLPSSSGGSGAGSSGAGADGGVYAAIAPRSQLDHALVEHCRDMGIAVHEGHAFINMVRNDANGVAVEIEGMGVVEADYVIAADGMWSPVRKALGLGTAGNLGEWHAFRQYYSNVTGTATTQLHVWFEEDLLPGYFWSFPLPGNRANVGLGILRTSGQSTKFMNNVWHTMMQRPHIAAALGADAVGEDRHTAWPIPARIDDAVRSSGRVLFVGDAVGACDNLTGEGIGQSLETGIFAANAINAGANPAEVRRIYSKHIDVHLLADHRMSVLLGRALAKPRAAKLVLRLVDTNAWTRRNFARWMFEDEPRAIVLTPRRWHKKFFARSGAYKA
jgi:flavin-dependent dehydrogenase